MALIMGSPRFFEGYGACSNQLLRWKNNIETFDLFKIYKPSVACCVSTFVIFFDKNHIYLMENCMQNNKLCICACTYQLLKSKTNMFITSTDWKKQKICKCK